MEFGSTNLISNLVLRDAGNYPGSSDGRDFACSEGDPGLIPGSGRASGEGSGNPPQYSWPGKSWRQRSLVGYSPWGHQSRT